VVEPPITDVWLVTGASSGLGRALVTELAAEGCRVAAVARTVAAGDDEERERYLGLAVDVADAHAVKDSVETAVTTFGRLDVVVNAAGHLLAGAVEEISPAALRRQFETNLDGPWNVVRAALPFFRRQGSGTVVNVSSIGGVVGLPGFSAYCASKFALEGMSESLAAETARFGVRTIIVEPGPYRTALRRSVARPDSRVEAYPSYADELARADGTQSGDPACAARAIIDAVAMREPPLHLPLGDEARETIGARLDARRAEMTRMTGLPSSTREAGCASC
jgi:NAD(P)-dependent dehydrogenase (short-subunit alcohol dehydrogenase family)